MAFDCQQTQQSPQEIGPLKQGRVGDPGFSFVPSGNAGRCVQLLASEGGSVIEEMRRRADTQAPRGADEPLQGTCYPLANDLVPVEIRVATQSVDPGGQIVVVLAHERRVTVHTTIGRCAAFEPGEQGAGHIACAGLLPEQDLRQIIAIKVAPLAE